jgi:mersacidin/lichenicidin family type 2 lantibiotic
MSAKDIIRAWKDPDYLNGLTAKQRSRLPDNPAGLIELTDDDLDAAAGGWSTYTNLSCSGTIWPCCISC